MAQRVVRGRACEPARAMEAGHPEGSRRQQQPSPPLAALVPRPPDTGRRALPSTHHTQALQSRLVEWTSCWSPWPRVSGVQQNHCQQPQPVRAEPAGWGSGAGSLQPLLSQVTMTRPCAPVVSFGIKHSDYMTPLVVDVD